MTSSNESLQPEKDSRRRCARILISPETPFTAHNKSLAPNPGSLAEDWLVLPRDSGTFHRIEEHREDHYGNDDGAHD